MLYVVKSLKHWGSKVSISESAGPLTDDATVKGKRQDLQRREAVVGSVAEISLFRSEGQESLFTLHNPIIQYNFSPAATAHLASTGGLQ
jgi:hypothetical protein